MQHTATHTTPHQATLCNTLQHLQHTATHHDNQGSLLIVAPHTATLCNTLQHPATPCNTLTVIAAVRASLVSAVAAVTEHLRSSASCQHTRPPPLRQPRLHFAFVWSEESEVRVLAQVWVRCGRRLWIFVLLLRLLALVFSPALPPRLKLLYI